MRTVSPATQRVPAPSAISPRRCNSWCGSRPASRSAIKLRRLRRLLVLVLTPALALIGTPLPAQAAREVRCESHGMRHAFCPTGSHADIRLMSSSGFWPCTQGRTWGTEPDGIWVDQGCKATFQVDDARGSRSDRDAAVGAVVALGVLAVLASNSARHDETSHAAGPPPWMVGSFNGYNPRYRLATTMSIGSNGRIVGRAAGQTVHGNWMGGDVIQFEDGVRSEITRTDRGFKLTQIDDRSNIVEYYRD